MPQYTMKTNETAPLAGSRMYKRLRFIGYIFLFFLFFGLASLLLPAKVDRSANFQEKIKRWNQVKDGVQVVAVGSSIIESAVRPDVLQEEGIRAFNLGLPSVKGFHMESVLEAVIESRPSSLQVVLIEVSDWPTGVREDQLRTAPSWHTLDRTIHAIWWAIQCGDLEGALERFRVFAERNVPLSSAFKSPVGPQRDHQIAGPDGFRPLDLMNMPKTLGRRMMEELPGEVVRTREPKHMRVNFRGLKRLERMCIDAGLKPVFLRAPNAMRYRNENREMYDDFVIVWFDDPLEYPMLFRKAFRWDEAHVNPSGAELISRKLAEFLLSESTLLAS